MLSLRPEISLRAQRCSATLEVLYSYVPLFRNCVGAFGTSITPAITPHILLKRNNIAAAVNHTVPMVPKKPFTLKWK